MHHHGAGLRRLLEVKKVEEARREELVEALLGDHSEADLDPEDRAMLDYSVKLTRTPGEMSGGDIERLRQAGFDDRGIHDICAIVGYFAFVNRIADGLGVELE